ncbi:MAG: PAS domain-containing protein [Nannocystis sp.]|nr:PAS domain-containing protein [Nannocystis sp.]
MSPASEARRRPSSVTYPLLVAITVAFAVWCVHLMVTTSASRQRLTERITWLRELDALDLAASEDPGSSATSQRYADLRAALLAADPNPALVTPLDQLGRAIARREDRLNLAVDALRRELRRENAAISAELGDAWDGLNLAALAALVFASGCLGLVAVARARARDARRLSRDLTRSEARARAIIELAADPILTVDAGGALISANKAAIDLLDLAGPAGDAHSGDYGRLADRLPAVDRLLRSPPAAPARLSAKVGDQTIPVAVSIATIDQHDDPRAVVILRDIRDDIRAEEALRLARDAALQASEAKSDFLANMSHELRTPLNAIIGYGELIREEVEEEGNASRVEDLNKQLAAAHHLLGLIDDILDLSKIEAGRLDLSIAPIDVTELITEVRATALPLAARQGNTFEVHLEPELGAIIGDRTRLRQILLNLLSNAAKYTEGGAIHLSVRRRREAGRDWLVFEVRDTGVGISPEALSRLFGAFERGDRSTRRRYRGTGLGLAITQRLCEHMGGRVSVDSEVGRGSTFTVRLPARPGPAAS